MRGLAAGGLVVLILGALPTTTPTAAAGTTYGPPSVDGAWTARLVSRSAVMTAPGGPLFETLEPFTSATGSSTTLLVLGSSVRHGHIWLRIRLPQRPNNASGWIRRDDAVLERSAYTIQISTGRRLLTLREAGRVLLRTEVVVGAPATPTPHGLFAIYDIVPLPKSPYAPYELQLTAHSDVLRTFDGGEGRVALHGMNGALRVPLGTSRSHGCIRLLPATAQVLGKTVPLGSLVAIS